MRNSRHRSRELAFQALYSVSFSPEGGPDQLEYAIRTAPREDGELPGEIDARAWELARGVYEHETALNAAIEKLSKNWRPERIGRIEMLLLRLALFEMLYTATPPKVVIAECMELAGEFGAGEARSFINGILDAAARSGIQFHTQ